MKKTLITLFVLGLAAAAFAGDVIDRIAAVVNDDIILLSEVDEKVFLLQAQGQLEGVKQDQVDTIRRDILDRLIEERLVVQRAKSQGITLDESEITTAVDAAIDRVKAQFPDEEAFRKALEQEGITYNMLRDRYEDDIRQERYVQRVVGREIRSQVDVQSDDVKRYYEEHRDELPGKPDEVHLAHLVAQPISADREREAVESIGAAYQQLLGGTDFDEVVKEYRGGKLGRFCPGDLDPSVEAVLDTLEVGAFSEPTRSLQGYHIFRMMERDGECWVLSHVLVPVPLKQEDIDRAQAKAQAAHDRIVAGEPFEKVVAEVSDDDLTRDNKGDLGWTALEGLVPAVTAALDSLEVGGISDVVVTERGFHVFKLLERRKGADYSFDEIRDRLYSFLEQQKLEEAYGKWLAAVRDSAYVEVKTWSR